MFVNRELSLPEMQRKYVWNSTQVRDLIDSIYRDYPSGLILIWETENLPEIKDHNFEKTNQEPIGKRLLLLDGQQRVSSLTTILEGRPIRIKEGTKIKEKTISLYFNLDHPEDNTDSKEETPRFDVGDLVEGRWEVDGIYYPGKIAEIDNKRYYVIYDDGDEGWTDEVRDISEEKKKDLYFQIKNKKIENNSNWISVTKLFKEGVGSILKDLKIGADNLNFDRYYERLSQLYGCKKYVYPIQIIRGKSYNEVTEIFIRINSSGTRLRGSDLALAQITSTWPGSMKLFEQFVDECIEKDFYLDENFLVRCIVCIATNQSKFDMMGKTSRETLKESWESTKKGVESTINFLKNNALVDGSALLPSPVLLIPLVYYASENNLCKTKESEKGFLYWLYNAAIWGRYSSSMESKLSQDIASLSSEKPWIALTENLWQQAGRNRGVNIEDIRGKGIGHPFFFMMYVIARKNQARDLETGNIINYANFGRNNKIEHDHIFPKSKLETLYKNKLDDSERKKIINEIANIAFMTKKGNIIKTNDDPISYFPKVFEKYGGDDYFKRQQIPYDLELLDYNKYPEFLDTRAGSLAKEINTFLDSLK